MRASQGIIVAVSPERVIGVGNTIPWKYPGDQRRFKKLTMGGALVMGRKTWESIGRPLPGRRNLVVTRGKAQGAECFRSVEEALAAVPADVPVWFIGGAGIYEAALRHADFIDVTYVPDHIAAEGAVRFPEIDERIWEPGPLVEHEEDPALTRRVYTRRTERT